MRTNTDREIFEELTKVAGMGFQELTSYLSTKICDNRVRILNGEDVRAELELEKLTRGEYFGILRGYVGVRLNHQGPGAVVERLRGLISNRNLQKINEEFIVPYSSNDEKAKLRTQIVISGMVIRAMEQALIREGYYSPKGKIRGMESDYKKIRKLFMQDKKDKFFGSLCKGYSIMIRGLLEAGKLDVQGLEGMLKERENTNPKNKKEFLILIAEKETIKGFLENIKNE